MLSYKLNIAGQSWTILSQESDSYVKLLASILALDESDDKNFTNFYLITTRAPKFENEKIILAEHHSPLPFAQPRQLDIGFATIWQSDNNLIFYLQRELQGESLVIFLKLLLLPLIDHAIANNGLLIHAGLIAKDDCGVLLAGPGDIGKSTASRRAKAPWRMLGDDTALIYQKNNSFFVQPIPTWSELYSGNWHLNWPLQCAKLKSIFFLTQNKKTIFSALPLNTAITYLYECTTQVYFHYFRYQDISTSDERDKKIKLFDNAIEIAKNIPCQLLQLPKNSRYWEKINVC